MPLPEFLKSRERKEREAREAQHARRQGVKSQLVSKVAESLREDPAKVRSAVDHVLYTYGKRDSDKALDLLLDGKVNEGQLVKQAASIAEITAKSSAMPHHAEAALALHPNDASKARRVAEVMSRAGEDNPSWARDALHLAEATHELVGRMRSLPKPDEETIARHAADILEVAKKSSTSLDNANWELIDHRSDTIRGDAPSRKTRAVYRDVKTAVENIKSEFQRDTGFAESVIGPGGQPYFPGYGPAEEKQSPLRDRIMKRAKEK
jgi:hypothetical protein